MSDQSRSSKGIGLSKVSIAIVEHLTAKVIGENAVEAIREQVLQEVRKGIVQALKNVEIRLAKEAKDRELVTLLDDFPLNTQGNVQEAVFNYYEHPTDKSLENILVENIRPLAPNRIQNAQIQDFVEQYLVILRQELIAFSPKSPLADKLAALSLQSMQSDTQQMRDILNEIHAVLQLMLQIPSLTQPARERSANEQQVRLGEFYMNQYDKLLGWLGLLNDAEFRAVIRSLMTPTEQNFLPRSVEIITRVDFLGDMQQRRRLNQVEEYFLNKYRDRLEE